MDKHMVEPTMPARRAALFREHLDSIHRATDHLLGWLMAGQWAFGLLIAVTFSPYSWSGKVHTTHVHVLSALFLGAAISSWPIVLAWLRPGAVVTRHVIAVAQMLWSALLIHLSGGRIETHFHVFGSLAILAFYRDWKVLVTATLVVALDHFVRGLVWPESVYGVVHPEWWRFLEHAFWVVFAVSFLAVSCMRGVKALRAICDRQAETESLSAREKEKAIALEQALAELSASQELMLRTEKLAAVGQLAASVAHELRNPLAAIQNAATYIGKKLGNGPSYPGSRPPPRANGDPRTVEFARIIEREVGACTRIISELLDFARERPPTRHPCPLRPLVEEAITMVRGEPGARIVNDVPDSLPVPQLDKEQFRQVLINLIQNAVEALPDDRGGEVKVNAHGGEDRPWVITVSDNGAGMPEDVASKVFQPLFTTKRKGTGLGLAIVHNMVTRHHGTIRIQSEVGIGTEFRIELPATGEGRSVVGANAKAKTEAEAAGAAA